MISNERPSPFARQPQRSYYQSQQPSYNRPAFNKPPSDETTLKTERVQVERKTFVLSLKENNRGRFLRIVEESKGHRDTIIVPSTGLDDFSKILTEMAAQGAQSPNPETPSQD